jgi:very-short-patch-repair endonuclease
MGNLIATKDAKREYLVRTFSRTKRKDYENYILNAIWHKLDRSDIQPVTQQFIKRSDGRYALMDLYFPQLCVGIECDERHHIENAKEDDRRELTMEQMLSAYDETEDFQLYRIKAYEPIEDVERQIDDTVAGIKDEIRRTRFQPWDFNESPYDIAIKKRMIHVADRLAFRTIVEVCRCFGKDYEGMQRAYFHIGHEHQLWCPKLATYSDGKYKSAARGWVNILTSDWENIIETRDDPDKKFSKDESITAPNRPTITFAKSTDILGRSAYRFIGVYKTDESDSRASETVHVHKRISRYIDLAPWLGEEKVSGKAPAKTGKE